MLLRETLPKGIMQKSTAEFLKEIPLRYLVDMMPTLEEFYEESYSMLPILRDYGVEIDSVSDNQQVNCSFKEHGTSDNHKSAKFFYEDRNTGKKSERVFCWKCQKVCTLFWYILKQAKDWKDLKMVDALVAAESRYGYRVPRSLILDYNVDNYYNIEKKENKTQRTMGLYRSAREIRNLLIDGKKSEYIQAIKELLNRGTVDEPAKHAMPAQANSSPNPFVIDIQL